MKLNMISKSTADDEDFEAAFNRVFDEQARKTEIQQKPGYLDNSNLWGDSDD